MAPLALSLSTASLFDVVACVHLFIVHSLVKESLIKGHLCSGGVKRQISIIQLSSLELAGAIRGSADVTTSLQCANGIWTCENQAIINFLP